MAQKGLSLQRLSHNLQNELEEYSHKVLFEQGVLDVPDMVSIVPSHWISCLVGICVVKSSWCFDHLKLLVSKEPDENSIE